MVAGSKVRCKSIDAGWECKGLSYVLGMELIKGAASHRFITASDSKLKNNLDLLDPMVMRQVFDDDPNGTSLFDACVTAG